MNESHERATTDVRITDVDIPINVLTELVFRIAIAAIIVFAILGAIGAVAFYVLQQADIV